MRFVRFLSICVLLALLGCSSGGDSDELVTSLLTDAEIASIDDGLVAKDSYPTGEDFGVITKAELVPGAEAGFVRQWTRDPFDASDGVAWSVVASVQRFGSAADADVEADRILELIGTTVFQVGPVRYSLTPPESGLSSGVAVATNGTTLLGIEVQFNGEGDADLVRALADLLDGRAA